MSYTFVMKIVSISLVTHMCTNPFIASQIPLLGVGVGLGGGGVGRGGGGGGGGGGN